ncbi:MAG: type II toxin-antitoxin system VapC family toxin [Verrucomicrobia bacterium]|nr:type II toxin-antitoxin system VapC family toxin [Verrucomicrobiota bacterium]
MELIVALDTNAYSDWRTSGRWHETLSLADSILVPTVVMGELFHGFRKGNQLVENQRRLEAFLSEPQVRIVEATRRTAGIYGEFLHHLQKQATPIPTNDIWIAAIVSEHSAVLLTRDPHFTHLPQLTVGIPKENES